MIDPDAFVRLVRGRFLRRIPRRQVACGGVVRIVNGSTVRRGPSPRQVKTLAQRPRIQHYPDRRVPARVPDRAHRLVEARRAADHLGRLRRLPPRRRDRGRRLRHHHGRRGRRARRAPAPPLPRARHPLPRGLPGRPGLLDGGAGLPAAAVAAQPLAPRAGRDARAAPRHDRAAPLRRGRHVRDALLCSSRRSHP